MTTTPHPHPRVYLTPAEQHDLLNEPIEPADPPMQPGDGLIWLAGMGISCAVAIAATVWIYNAIFH